MSSVPVLADCSGNTAEFCACYPRLFRRHRGVQCLFSPTVQETPLSSVPVLSDCSEDTAEFCAYSPQLFRRHR